MVASRLLTAGTVLALGTVACGVPSRPVAHASAGATAPPESHAAVHSPLLQPIKLDRKNAQLRLVQVVFRCDDSLDYCPQHTGLVQHLPHLRALASQSD